MNLSIDDQIEIYEEYEAGFLNKDRRYRRQNRGKSKKKENVNPDELTDFDDNENEFVPSYAAGLDPLHHERRWLIRSLGGFYRDNLIEDVTKIVKAGKEANVYCCRATATAGAPLLAAKLYRPRMLRHLRNDAIYKEGRMTIDSEGKEMRRSRETRALQKKTRFGKHLGFMTWIVHEYQVQTELFSQGADVPKPIAYQDNTILMSFVGDEWSPAPTLNEISLEINEAKPLFDLVMKNIRLMLSNHYIHGDLSAYNILYWNGAIKIIDFPQVADARTNRNAFMFLERDIRRACEYFARFGVSCDPVTTAAGYWDAYLHGRL